MRTMGQLAKWFFHPQQMQLCFTPIMPEAPPPLSHQLVHNKDTFWTIIVISSLLSSPAQLSPLNAQYMYIPEYMMAPLPPPPI